MRTQRKRFEYRADVQKNIDEGNLLLAGTDVFLNESETIYSQDEYTDEQMLKDFEIKGGTWYTKDGWIVGKTPIAARV